jgi:hypothetical protein
MAIFFDTHAHLDYPDYANDLPEVVARAQAAGIKNHFHRHKPRQQRTRHPPRRKISGRLCRRRLASDRAQ